MSKNISKNRVVKWLSLTTLILTSLIFSNQVLAFSITITDSSTNQNITNSTLLEGKSYKINFTRVSYLRSVNQVSNGFAVSDPISPGSAISKPAGTYYYGATWCSPYGGCQLDTSYLVSITITKPVTPPKVSASFNKRSIAEGQSAIFNWSSNNTTNCNGTGIPGITGRSGSVEYTAPEAMAGPVTLQVDVTCISTQGSVSITSSIYIAGVFSYDYEYDELGRLIEVVDPNNGVRTYDYDKAGNRSNVFVTPLN